MELPKCYKLLKENLLGIAHWIDWYTLFLNLNYQDMIFIVKLRRKLKPILSNLPSSSAVAGQFGGESCALQLLETVTEGDLYGSSRSFAANETASNHTPNFLL